MLTFQILKSLKLSDKEVLSKPLHETLPKVIFDQFMLSFYSHLCNMRWAKQGCFSSYQNLW